MLRITRTLSLATLAPTVRIFVASSVRSFAVAPDAVIRNKDSRGPAKKPEPNDLASVLEREIAYEREDTTTAETLKSLAAGITEFKVTDKPGLSRFSLLRTMANGQEVRVDVDCTPVTADDDEDVEDEGDEAPDGDDEKGEDEDVPAEGYRVLVSIRDAAKGRVMQAGGLVTDHLRIHRVALYEAGKEPSPDTVFSGADEVSVYAGPSFEELDEALQNAFYEYLEERGVHDDLAVTLSDYASTKEQIEYVRWLEGVKDFAK